MNPTVTVACLIYKSSEWLRWVLQRLVWARNDTPYEVLVLGNDANIDVGEFIRAHAVGARATSTLCSLGITAGLSIQFRYVDFRNENPYEYNMARVYRAWNECFRYAEAEDVVLINSDMAFGNHWLDALLECRAANPKCLPTSLLVESGRLVSSLPEYVMDFGTTPKTFQQDAWMLHAERLRARSEFSVAGGLFMPVLWRKKDFEKIGGYPIQERSHVLASDAVAFNRAAEMLGLEHRTSMQSICYHVQEGETRDE